ncbi:MAG TPA: hypothetical protein VMB75_10610, partial [Rhodocyclaceae bacterium]|nr:hypothetical protein [Rhodocyclaceae bacterium]
YAGPRRAAAEGAVRVVLFGPRAAEVAARPEVRAALGSGEGRWELIPVASDQNWGAASTQLVQALFDRHAAAIVALDNASAHLAEQLALKAFVPVVATSDDRRLTSTNVPWIFRLPAAAAPEEALKVLEAAARRGGTTAVGLRDALASGGELAGVAFEQTGEPRGGN